MNELYYLSRDTYDGPTRTSDKVILNERPASGTRCR